MLDASGVTSLRLARVLFGFLLLCVASLFASPLPCAQATGASPAPARSGSIVGIVEGEVSLIRQTTRYALAEGVLLNDQDIIETAPGAFAQIELPGGVLVGIGESTRLMLAPSRRQGADGAAALSARGLAQDHRPRRLRLHRPRRRGGDAGRRCRHPHQGGAVRVVRRIRLRRAGRCATARERSCNWPRRLRTAARRHHANGRAACHARVREQGAEPVSRSTARAWRAARQRNVAPKARGEISYADVAAWLRTEPALRLPLLPLWQSRAADPDFPGRGQGRSGATPRVGALCRPRGYARRLAEEAERRRAREAAPQRHGPRRLPLLLLPPPPLPPQPHPRPGSIPAASGTSTGRGTSQ